MAAWGTCRHIYFDRSEENDLGYRLDHLVVSAATLQEGRLHLEALLDTPLTPRGAHATMATHNHLVRLNDGAYLETIAVDHDVLRPDFPRWFDLDNFAGPPKLSNWVINCDDLDEAWQRAPANTGRIMDFERGAYRWRMIVPETGVLPFNNGFPAIIEWDGAHPAPNLPATDISLRRLRITHPDATPLRAALAPFVEAMENVQIVQGKTIAFAAELSTPSGEIWIS